MESAKYKIILFGDGGVGKTTLVNRYLTGVFNSEYDITIGVELYVKKLEVEGKNITLHIWDFAGEKDYRFLFPNYVQGAYGGIFMFDLTQYDSLKNLYEWLLILGEGAIDYEKGVPLIMVGGKLDLEDSRVITTDQAKKIAERFKFKGYFECSSKTGQNINTIFEELTKIILKKQ